MSRLAAVSVTFVGDGDDSQAQTVWATTDMGVVHTLIDQLRGLLGEPVCEVVLGHSAVAAIEAAGDASGALITYASDAR